MWRRRAQQSSTARGTTPSFSTTPPTMNIAMMPIRASRRSDRCPKGISYFVTVNNNPTYWSPQNLSKEVGDSQTKRDE